MSICNERFTEDLRGWRERRKLSQLDLALRAGTTQRHLSFIEQGRSTPGRGIVIRLAEALELTLRERNKLLQSAGFTPAYAEEDYTGHELRPVRHAIETVLHGHNPFPALVAQTNGEIVAVNHAMDVIFEGVDPGLLRPPMNTFRIALLPNGMAPRIRNFDQWAQHVINALRLNVHRSPDPTTAALLQELEPHIPTNKVGTDYLGFAVPMVLDSLDGTLTLMTTLTTFATPTDATVADLHLEAFLPTNELTQTILQTRSARRTRTP